MNVRRQCVEILQQILEQKKFFNELKQNMEEQNKAFVNMLVLTTLRHLESIQKILDNFLHKQIPAKHKKASYILLLGIAEIFYLKTPTYAIINEYVKLAKEYSNQYVANMVNAVLRRIEQQKENLNTVFKNPEFPKNFKNILIHDYTPSEIQASASMLGDEAPLDITPKNACQFWAEKLNGVLFANGTIRLNKPKMPIADMAGFSEGQWWVQDLAASLPVLLLGDVKGQNILDLCAAPGGKTAQLLAAGAKVTAVDVDVSRMEKLRKNMTRLQLSENLTTVVCDAISFLDACKTSFDGIVLDAPCSASGTFRRHPEIIYIKTTDDVQEQAEKQHLFLQKSAEKLKSGGKLLFCTCSIAKDEGERQVEKFLCVHNEFVSVSADLKKINRYDGIKLDEKIIDKGVLRTLPYYMKNMGGMDAFFAACLQKK